jgi:4-hydroxy-tetrahydrodipicolinate reductase
LDVKLDKSDDLNAVLNQFEVLIDFTRPEATLDYLATCLSANKAMVIGQNSNNKSSLPRY